VTTNKGGFKMKQTKIPKNMWYIGKEEFMYKDVIDQKVMPKTFYVLMDKKDSTAYVMDPKTETTIRYDVMKKVSEKNKKANRLEELV